LNAVKTALQPAGVIGAATTEIKLVSKHSEIQSSQTASSHRLHRDINCTPSGSHDLVQFEDGFLTFSNSTDKLIRREQGRR
jgi:hypothetical protein